MSRKSQRPIYKLNFEPINVCMYVSKHTYTQMYVCDDEKPIRTTITTNNNNLTNNPQDAASVILWYAGDWSAIGK